MTIIVLGPKEIALVGIYQSIVVSLWQRATFWSSPQRMSKSPLFDRDRKVLTAESTGAAGLKGFWTPMKIYTSLGRFLN